MVQIADLEVSYTCELGALPAALRARFVQLDYDAGAQAFVERARKLRASPLRTQLFRGLQAVISDYDAYGLLDMYAMHLLSTAQWQHLLGATHGAQRLLDVGAGDGGVTQQGARWFSEVVVTEASPVLRRKLRARGFRVEEHDLGQAPWPHAERFDVVSALNVLDRTLRPRTLLSHLRDALAPAGKLLLALPLPLAPHVHVGARTVDPDEPLPAASPSFEQGVVSLVQQLLQPAGLRVVRFTRLPYLCQGDARQALYALSDVVFVCERQSEPPPHRPGDPQKQAKSATTG